jgi:Flp pilus assembly protein TadD
LKKKSASKSTRFAPVPADAAPGSLWPRLWPYLLLAALAFGIYANALGNGFVSDDDTLILSNPLVTDWAAIPQLFQRDSWAGLGQGGNFRPVQMLLYMTLYHAFGFNAFPFHLSMLLMHTANALLVYVLARRLLPSRNAALVAGILFAVHPIHNEAVVWLSAHDALMTIEVLTSLLLFIRWDAAPRPPQIAALAALFAVVLLSKEPGAMLVPLLAGYEFLYLGRALWSPKDAKDRRTLWDNWALYASLTSVFGIYVWLRIHALGRMSPWQDLHYSLQGKVLILSVIATLGQYFSKLVAPIHLQYFYSFEATNSVTPAVIAALALELGVLAAIILLRRRSPDSRSDGNGPAISYGLFFILASLAPLLNLNGLGDDVFTERYVYLPSVGFVLAAAVLWEWLAAKQREVAWAALVAAVAASAWILLPRNLDWHDDERLFTVSAAAAPKSGAMAADLGWIHLRRQEYDAAIEQYQTAVNLQPEKASFHTLLGNAYVQKGRYRDAASEFRKAIELRPSTAEAHLGLGLALAKLGDVPSAIAEQTEALRLKPDYAEAYTALALLRMKENDYSTAVDLLQRAVAANPQYIEALINLGVAFNNRNRYEEGAAAFRKAIEAAPSHAGIYLAHYNLGLSYSHLSSPEAAAMEFAKSLQLKPDFAAARDALAEARGMRQPQPVQRP